MNIDKVRELFNAGKFVISSHCRMRMDERDIKISDIGNAIMNGEIKENLLLITVYFPDSNKFTDNFSRRL